MEKKIFPVLGMTCAACATRVDKTLNGQTGVQCAAVNLAASTATVEYDETVCNPAQLKAAVQAAGYDLLVEGNRKELRDKADKAFEKNYRRLKRRATWAMGLALPVAFISMFLSYLPFANLIMCVLATPVVFWFGRDFHNNAFRLLRHGSANMDTLVSVSTLIAYFFSLFNLIFPSFWTSRGVEPHVYFEASAVIIAFILTGRLLEERAKGNTTSAIKSLMGLQPQTVTVVAPDGSSVETAIEEVREGMTVMVKPGERVAVDGHILLGSSHIDESMLTGESVPVAKDVGDPVFAGTLNQRGVFRFCADKVGTDTVLAHIIKMVQDAQGSKSHVERLADRVSAVFVPTIICIAVVTFALWWAFAEENGFTYGLLAMVTVLIIACPCALGLATPTAIMVGIGKGAAAGILIKDAESLETARKVDCIVMDKTGTITEGKPVVMDLLWAVEHPGILRDAFYTLEKCSEHPLAEAITAHLHGSELPMRDYESLTGLGARGAIYDDVYFVGNRKLMHKEGIIVDGYTASAAARMEQAGQTVVYFADSSRTWAVAAVADCIKPSSAAAVAELRSLGVEVYMLSGDNETVTAHVAAEAGIRHYCAGVSPEGKADFVDGLKREGHCVAMVGDGINDSAALARADLSVAMGRGSDIAMDVAQMTLVSSDLTKISEAIRLSDLTVRTIRQNLFWAFIYNLIGVPLAAGILYPFCGFLLNPMIAGAAMAMSSVSVVTNSLRLRSKKLRADNGNRTTNYNEMKKEYRVEGMMCDHCRQHVENALNGVEGVHATVTLDPPVAAVTCTGREVPFEELRAAVTAAGYSLLEQ